MWQMTGDMWHVAHGEAWTFSQSFSFLALNGLGVMMFWWSGGNGWLSQGSNPPKNLIQFGHSPKGGGPVPILLLQQCCSSIRKLLPLDSETGWPEDSGWRLISLNSKTEMILHFKFCFTILVIVPSSPLTNNVDHVSIIQDSLKLTNYWIKYNFLPIKLQV